MLKKLIAFLAVCLFITSADAATRGTTATVSRGSAATSGTATRSSTSSVSARSATTSARSAAPATSNATTARAATTGRTTVSRTSASTTSTPTVAARAATTQKVLNTGTSIAAANENTALDSTCRQKYYGCMDSFCMLDNDSGGRCICSDRNAELDEILAEIERMDTQSYQMATLGVESIEGGFDVASAGQITIPDTTGTKNVVDLSLWDATNLFSDSGDSMANPLDGKEGDDLFAASHQICVQQMPECADDFSMLQLMYKQQIRSDCSAYENALKQQRNASQEKLNAAQSALRAASYEQLQAANKYDLGQCTVEFKNCMMTTGGCGEDFSGCATVAAFDNTNARGRGISARTHTIKGAQTNISIYASTYDMLYSKKPLCESVMENCTAVADQVWDTFLREAAPQIKNAELIAEDNARQNCIGNISSCFQQACRDTMDPNDPDGSYDMCLTRPETMLNLCQIPLNACGISTTSAADAQESQIWDFVVARLASMRVNSCTEQFKECLQSEDLCGSDYTQCVGLDTDTIMRMCPYDSLVGCQQVYDSTNIRGDAVYDELYNVAQGIFLNIDNEMLDYCQSALDEALITACGSTDSCDKFLLDDSVGTRSLQYNICDFAIVDENQIGYANCRTDISQITDTELGRNPNATSDALGPMSPLAAVISGTIWWDGVEIDDDGNISTVDEYFSNIDITNASDAEKEMVAAELTALQNNLNTIYNIIDSDPTVAFCTTGREVQGIKPYSGTTVSRFPDLADSAKMKIATSALNAARENYYKRYDELNEKMSQDYAALAERIAEIRGENGKDARREMARQACVNLAEGSALPKSETPKSLAGIITSIAVIVAAAIVVTVFTAGAGTLAIAAGTSAGLIAGGGGGAAGAIGAAAGTAAASSMVAGAGAGGAMLAGTLTGAASAGIAAGTSAGIIAGAGAAAGMSAAGAMLATAPIVAVSVGAAGAAALTAGTTAALAVDYSNASGKNATLELSGRYENEQWNYRETITTDFNMDTLVCHKCITTQNCESIRSPFFGSKSCKKWADPQPASCTDIQF